MSCTSCKKKKSFIEEKEELLSGFNSSAIGFAIIWSILALYGLYSLIMLFVWVKSQNIWSLWCWIKKEKKFFTKATEEQPSTNTGENVKHRKNPRIVRKIGVDLELD